jgi:hypothetical protein
MDFAGIPLGCRPPGVRDYAGIRSALLRDDSRVWVPFGIRGLDWVRLGI